MQESGHRRRGRPIHRPAPIPHPDQHFPASRERPEERAPSPLTLTRLKSGRA